MIANSRPRRLPEVLTEQELAALVRQPNRRAPTGCRNLALLLCMARCGLRVGEALALEHRDTQGGQLTIREGKGAKDRVVPLDPQTAQALDAWWEVRGRLGANGRRVFVTITHRTTGRARINGRELDTSTQPGQPLSACYTRQMVARYAQKAGIEKRVHPHTLRHTAATTWLRQGFNTREVQELLGHASLVTTQVYTHVFPEELRAKMQGLTPV